MLTALLLAAVKALVSTAFGAAGGLLGGFFHDRAVRRQTQTEDQLHDDEKTIQQQQEEIAIADRPDASPADVRDRMRRNDL